MKRALIGLFIFLSLLNIYAVLIQWQMGIYFTKPLLMISLSLWFYLSVKNHVTSYSKSIMAGLLFSIAGDTFLMFVNKNPYFFLLGLGSFLITHLFYIAAFSKHLGFKKGFVLKNKWVVLPVLFYSVGFIYYLWPDLPGDFLIPVIVYSSAISTMLISCINMKGRVSDSIANGLIIGAVIFVTSDSFIAINKFKTTGVPDEYMGVLIMVTYLVGQYFIAYNSVQINNGSN